jgi:hypothetical protein
VCEWIGWWNIESSWNWGLFGISWTTHEEGIVNEYEWSDCEK